jgi:hypothetical protein
MHKKDFLICCSAGWFLGGSTRAERFLGCVGAAIAVVRFVRLVIQGKEHEL